MGANRYPGATRVTIPAKVFGKVVGAPRFGTEGSVVRIHSPRPLFLRKSSNSVVPITRFHPSDQSLKLGFLRRSKCARHCSAAIVRLMLVEDCHANAGGRLVVVSRPCRCSGAHADKHFGVVACQTAVRIVL